MKNKVTLFGIGTVIGAVVIICAILFFRAQTVVAPESIACTQEAKICPDGSSVGRTGPSCEFAACPSPATTTATEAIPDPNQTPLQGTFSQRGVTIIPIALIEDSRCPADVKCVQAGTVRVNSQLHYGTTTQTLPLQLNLPTNFAGMTVTLTGVSPIASSKTEIASLDYRFGFSVVPQVPQARGTLQGKVDVGPACPVERVDNPCMPSPQMYAAQKIAVYTSTDKSKLVTTITPDAQGKFSVSLPVGKYYLDRATQSAVGSTTGLPTSVFINEGALVHLDISIDTGIR